MRSLLRGVRRISRRHDWRRDVQAVSDHPGRRRRGHGRCDLHRLRFPADRRRGARLSVPPSGGVDGSMIETVREPARPAFTRYVAGFLFTNDGRAVVLVRKNKPAWQKGRLNGVGGKVEGDETPAAAMQREFREEAGVDIPADAWQEVVVLEGHGFAVHFFRLFDTQAFSFATTVEGET